MMKKPIAIHFNDIHLKPGNEKDIIESTKYMVDYAKKIEVDIIINGGDWFDSRTSQRISVLEAAESMLDIINEAGMVMHLNVGNHSKSDYSRSYSYGEVFKHHPAMILHSHTDYANIHGIDFTFIPFYSNDILIPMINEAKGSDILIGHWEMHGSSNLGQITTDKSITPSMLSKYKKVYLSHYHNTHEITEDIIHLPSFRQNNYGEDNIKGFTVIYDDLSYEIIDGKFEEYLKIEINLETMSHKEIFEIANEVKDITDSVNIRFEVVGSEALVQSFDSSQLNDMGIDVKKKRSDLIVDEIEELTPESELFIWDNSSIKKKFVDFCTKKLLDSKKGLPLLKRIIN